VWLNGEFYNSLDAATQSVLAEIPIDATRLDGELGQLKRKIFLLDSSEYGFFGLGSLNSPMTEYFANKPDRTPAKFNGTVVQQWTRANSRTSNVANAISTTGTLLELNPFTVQAGIRPAFMLPFDFEVTVGLPSTANTMATSEVI
jgi:hypothetical protein